MTKIYVPTVKLKDIGKLDCKRKLPTKGRIAVLEGKYAYTRKH